MVKSKKRLFLLLVMILVLAMSMSLLVACNSHKKGPKPGEYNVTFMVKENGNGAWKEVTTIKSNAEGVVTLPKDPAVPGYSFRAWYTDEACQNKFEGTGVTADMKVYAFLSDKLVNVSIKGADGTINKVEKQTVAGLNKLEEAEVAKAKAANLTFDGFYTNEGYTTKFDINSESKDIYARYAAKVEYYNGYENLVEKLINPGEKVTALKVEDIKKDYMDKDGISFVSNSDRKTPFNFNEAINTNTVVRINWQSPFLEYRIVKNTNMAQVNGFDYKEDNRALIDSFQVVSIPNRVTIDGSDYNVVGSYLSPYSAKALKKIIFQEGIEYVSNLSNSIVATKLESVELPSTLKYLEDSFNNMPEVAKKVVLPEGLLAIYDCFWANYEGHVVDSLRTSGYDFEVKVPASVKNIVSVPNNLVYAEGSTFYNEGNFVINNSEEFGKTIVAITQQAVVNDNLTIPAGIEGLQVGVFAGLKFDYLGLPASFKNVAYNLEKSENPTYIPSRGRMSIRDAVNTSDANPQKSGMGSLGFALIPNLNHFEYVMFDSAVYPENMNKYAFCDWERAPGDTQSALTPFNQLVKKNVVFIAKKAAGEAVNINVTTTNTMNGAINEMIIKDVNSGDALTEAVLLEKSGLTEAALGYKFKINSIKQFGNAVDFSQGIERNQYIDIEYVFAATGFKTEEDKDGNLIVTGIDTATAQDLGTNSDPALSTYLVAIPNEINGKKIVAIKDSAFENNKNLGKIYIANSVKTIGAKAFKNAKNLEYVEIASGGLEMIGAEAFQYAGAIEVDGKYTCNPDLTKVDLTMNGATPVPTLRIKLPLAALNKDVNVRAIGANAFDTPALRTFEVAKGEENRLALILIIMGCENWELEEGGYYFLSYGHDNDSKKYEIIAIERYRGTTAGKDIPLGLDTEIDVNILDFDYVATAAGTNHSGGSLTFGGLRESFIDLTAEKNHIRNAILAGSVQLYEPDSANTHGFNEIVFPIVSKVEANAFGYLNEKFTKINEWQGEKSCNFSYMKPANHSIYLDKEQLQGQDPEIFEEGWFQGKPNKDNTFMQFANEGSMNLPGM